MKHPITIILLTVVSAFAPVVNAADIAAPDQAALVKDSAPGPFLPGDWGFSRAKGSQVYLFIHHWQPGHLMQFPNSELPIVERSAKALTGGNVSIEWATGIQVFMARAERNPDTTVIEYAVTGDAEKMHKVSVPDWRDPALNAVPAAMAAWVISDSGARRTMPSPSPARLTKPLPVVAARSAGRNSAA